MPRAQSREGGALVVLRFERGQTRPLPVCIGNPEARRARRRARQRPARAVVRRTHRQPRLQDRPPRRTAASRHRRQRAAIGGHRQPRQPPQGDRRPLDLGVATWSTEWNYGPGWDRPLLDAYGIEPDPERTAYYRLLGISRRRASQSRRPRHAGAHRTTRPINADSARPDVPMGTSGAADDRPPPSPYRSDVVCCPFPAAYVCSKSLPAIRTR
jgi:hypothetical protein